MTGIVFELNAFLEDEEGRKPLYVRISAPYPVPGEISYFCRVHAPSIFADDKRVYGVDQEQAVELAIKFIISMLEGKRVTDTNGNPHHW